MSVCRPLFTDEERAALQATVSTTEQQMCTVKTESRLGYKSSEV